MRLILACLSAVLCAGDAYGQPQTFTSGSTGADGALTYGANLGMVYFPPTGLSVHSNGIYNFTTITIGSGTTVRVSGWVFNTPVYWLAQGDVTIGGILDLSGQAGHVPNSPSMRAPSEPGAGGFSGGVGRGSAGQNATAGNGPGGGVAPVSSGPFPQCGGNATFSGSTYLQPLLGGSGGGGACSSNSNCGGGGAGGGAILIASSTKITINGGAAIYAFGGNGTGGPLTGNGGGPGSGGAVRLVSNTVISLGVISMFGGATAAGCSNVTGGSGIVRFEGSTVTLSGGAVQGTVITSVPYNLALPVGGPSVLSVVSVNGVGILANPFSFPDATIATGSSVPVVISGANIPSGTTGNLFIFSENAADQVIPFTLTGTTASTTATVNVPFPADGSRGFAKVTWMSQ